MYQLTKNGVRLIEQGLFIPNDPLNRDWVAYQKWQEQGNAPLLAESAGGQSSVTGLSVGSVGNP